MFLHVFMIFFMYFQNTSVMLEDQIPDGMFHIGDSVFVYPSTFQGHTSVHIRRYKKFGSKFYPTQEGVTLQPWWIQYVMGRSDVPQTSKDLQDNILKFDNQFKVESSDFQNFIFTRLKISRTGVCFFKTIIITKEQWKKMLEQYESISTAVSDEFYRSMDFLAAYKNVNELPLDLTLPSSLDLSLGQQYLNDILQKSFCTYMTSNGCLQEPNKVAEELFGNREVTFNNVALCQDVQELVLLFHENLWEETNFLALRPQSYLTQDFLKNVCLKNVLQKTRKMFCPENSFEFFEDLL